jgi:glycosyltransferase involved in cell wall biosynthesis
MSTNTPITCIVHTRNSESTVEAALDSVAWADELLVVDMESEDRTREIAAGYATRILEAPVAPRVDGIRNRYLEEARHQWILVLDSDERLADDGEEAVRSLVAEAGTEIDAYAIPRFNTIAGQVMRGSGWYPDAQIRLFRKGTVRWHDVHHRGAEVLTGRARRRRLEPPGCLHIHHRNYESLAHFIRKQVDYALTDRYDDDPSAFRFEAYVSRAHENLAARRDPDHDGDLSHALSLLMAWNELVRGLVHWERLDPRPPLGEAAALPARAEERSPTRGPRRWLRRRR